MARILEAEPVYAMAAAFRQRCLVEGRSLLWPDQAAWTPENLDALWEAFVGNPKEGKRSFMEKWRDQLAGQPRDVHRVAADLMALYYLFPSNIGGAAKTNGVREIVGWELGDEGEPPAMPDLAAAFARNIGGSGIYYLTGRPWQVAFFLRFAQRVIAGDADPYNVDACRRLADAVQAEVNGSKAARNVLLHLLFPEQFERIASDEHKRLILKAFPELSGSLGNVDDALLRIRAALLDELQRPHLDFYEPDLKARWDPADDETVPDLDGDGPDGGASLFAAATLGDLAAATHLDPAFLEEIASLLEEKKQLVFEGPPGSGKTYVAELVARWFAGLPLAGPPDRRVEIVQFHQSYGYEDFVQGIRPESDREGRLRYRVRDGVFKRLCATAAANPDRRYVLLIDEINRGNISRIFGELLLLLEYREKRALLPYAPEDAGDEAYLSVPPNLFLIGTMNSTDRSLAQVDYALRRRFYFVRFLPLENGRARVLEGWFQANKVAVGDRTRLLQLFVALNGRVEELLGPDFQVGHSYFMTKDIATERGLDRVWDRAVRPLLGEYLHHHRDREMVLAGMEPTLLLAASMSADENTWTDQSVGDELGE